MSTDVQSTRPVGFTLRNVSLTKSCGTPHQCPCCGACVAAWWASHFNQMVCPACGLTDRHRASCYDLLTDTPHALATPLAFVAYFGPERAHVEALRTASPPINLLELDFFAPGYQYARTTVRADVQDIPLQDSSVDGVIILHVLEHVPRFQTAIRELYRILRPGGFIQHETPCYRTKLANAQPDWSNSDSSASRSSVEDCKATRLSKPGYLCRQLDHLWGFDCAFLRQRFESEGFHCHPYRALTQRVAERFIGAPTFRVLRVVAHPWKAVVTMQDRYRCEKPNLGNGKPHNRQ